MKEPSGFNSGRLEHFCPSKNTVKDLCNARFAVKRETTPRRAAPPAKRQVFSLGRSASGGRLRRLGKLACARHFSLTASRATHIVCCGKVFNFVCAQREKRTSSEAASGSARTREEHVAESGNRKNTGPFRNANRLCPINTFPCPETASARSGRDDYPVPCPFLLGIILFSCTSARIPARFVKRNSISSKA